MTRQDYLKIIIKTFIIFIASCGLVFAASDGFVAAKKISGKYFTVFCESGVDLPALATQLDIGPSERLLAGETTASRFGSAQNLVEMFDTLFIRVCNILDMRLYNNFTGKIKICKDNQSLQRIYLGLFSKKLEQGFPFYVYSLNTIYVSAENFNTAAIGHEIAHAVISHYFVVLPPAKTQEILSGYVEYQLRKSK